MKKNISIVIFVFALCSFSFAAKKEKTEKSSSKDAYSEVAIKNYPLADYSEVMESKLSKEALFQYTCDWIIANRSKLDGIPPIKNPYPCLGFQNSNVISMTITTKRILTYSVDTNLPEVTFNLIIQFKDNKMKVSTLAAGTNVYSGDGKIAARLEHSSGNEFANDLKIRQKAYEIYIAKRNEILSALRQIAAGTIQTEEW